MVQGAKAMMESGALASRRYSTPRDEAVSTKDPDFAVLREKAEWVWRETLRIHKIAPGIRIASCLSCVEIFATLYYGGLLNHDPANLFWEHRDRLIVSKSHGAVSLYPILADLGYFDMSELGRVGEKGSILNDIPDCSVPGFETVNGSLGHGLGVGCGMALGLQKKGGDRHVFVISGDGEFYEGSVWEAMMFAAHHRLSNLILIVDRNRISMLDRCKNILDIDPLEEKFAMFKWEVETVNGHDVEELYRGLLALVTSRKPMPKVLLADTIKGRGVDRLIKDPLCHIKALSPQEIDDLLAGF
jgi:transketolase